MLVKRLAAFLLPFLLLACGHPRLSKTETQHFVINKEEVDSSTYKYIQPYKEKLDDAMNEVIGFAPEALVKHQPESNLTNFFAEAMMEKAKKITKDTADLVALFNYGGIRTSVPQGDVRVGNMYEVMPFENQLVFLPLKGSELQKVLDLLAEKGGAPVAGVRFTIQNRKAIDIFVRQTLLDTTKMYTVATSDYLANGGDRFFGTDTPKNYTNSQILLRDILIEHCRNLKKQNKPVSGQPDGRISVAK